MNVVDLDSFQRQVDCTYRGDHYSVRDNGAVLRHPRPGERKRPLDDIWTFGTPCSSTGYMKMSSETMHRILATAFLGPQPSKDHVVDHIDTNRRNNRPENLRWLTRLENILLNPITAKRVEYLYGSIENFLTDPSNPRFGTLTKDFEWMRTVTKAEAEYSRARMLDWAQSDRLSSGGTLGDWIFRPRREPRADKAGPAFSSSRPPQANRPGISPAESDQEQRRGYAQQGLEESVEALVRSKTPGAVQRNWRVPAEFPLTPEAGQEQSLESYFRDLKDEAVFAITKFGNTKVAKAAMSPNREALFVLGQQGGQSVKPWSLAKVTYEDGSFVHESRGTYFAREGAEKRFILAQGLAWGGGDSIDDYC
jgi:hypothetical protein